MSYIIWPYNTCTQVNYYEDNKFSIQCFLSFFFSKLKKENALNYFSLRLSLLNNVKKSIKLLYFP